jgi:hypothetical protein
VARPSWSRWVNQRKQDACARGIGDKKGAADSADGRRAKARLRDGVGEGIEETKKAPRTLRVGALFRSDSLFTFAAEEPEAEQADNSETEHRRFPRSP